MTIKNRNILIITGIILSSILFLLGVFLFVLCLINFDKVSRLLPVYNGKLWGWFVPFNSIWVSMGAGLFLGLGGIVSSLFVVNLFQKTQTSEISFYVLFSVFSVLEVFRMIFPFQALYTLSPDLLLSVSRILLFSRILGMLALAGTGIFSSQSNSSQTGKIISSIIAISFFFALYIPFDTGRWTECLIHKPGYLSMFFVLYALCVGAAFFSFYCSTEAQTSGEFRKAAWGILFLFLGYLGLLLTSSLVIVCIAVVFYVLGTVLLLRGIHRYYLWN